MVTVIIITEVQFVSRYYSQIQAQCAGVSAAVMQELGSMKNHQKLACYNVTIQILFRILFTYCSYMLFVD